MEVINDSSSVTLSFHSKKPLVTTPIKTTPVGSTLFPVDRSNTNLITQVQNQNFAFCAPRGSVLLEGGTGKLFGSESRAEKKPMSIIPTKSEMLCDIFVAMINSVRLLRMKGVPATLTKLVSSIESLTDRRFTLHHLAQLKYIVPEVIKAKKIRVENEKTNCMQEDLLLLLEMDAVEIDKNAEGGNGYPQLKKIFRSRVSEYFKTHLEDDDIPEGELPHLFYQPKQEPQTNSKTTSMPLVASLIAPSFKRRFSSKQLGGQVPEPAAVDKSTFLSEMPKEAISSGAHDGSSGSAVAADEALGLVSTPVKLASLPQITSTPSELASTPARLMAAIPALCASKRTLVSSDDDTFELSSKSSKRRLKFNESDVGIEDELSRVDEEEHILPGLGSAIAKDDVLSVLPRNLLQSLMDKEITIVEEKDPTISQARKRQQMMAGVPKLFDMLRLFFQSLGRTVVTKDELIYKLLSGHVEITDRTEVEEQLKLLQELAPEYISEQISAGGDTLIRLNKYSSPDSICAKLLEAS